MGRDRWRTETRETRHRARRAGIVSAARSPSNFGSLALRAQTASRRPGPILQIDANDRSSIRRRSCDGRCRYRCGRPFHDRSTALIEAAIEIGFDVVDLNDNLRYAESVVALEPQIAAPEFAC